MTVQEEIRQRIERDALLARLRVKIDSGNATFADTSAYNNRSAEILGDVFSRRLPDISPAEREAICVELLQERYSDINSLLARVQRSLDEMIGLQLAPQHAPFNSERAHQIGRSTADPTVSEETQQRRARSAPATATRAMHDDYTRKNADFRSNAGLKCYINRESVPGCCAWCSAMAGRYEYGEEPDDVYRRHDNCGCTVTFENGRQRQDVWSKQTWEAPDRDVGADEPVILTEEQAAAAGAGERAVLTKEQTAAAGAGEPVRFTREQAANERLTNAAGSGTMETAEERDENAARRRYDAMTREQRVEVIRRGIRESDATFSYDTAESHAMEYLRKAEPMPNAFDVRAHGTDSLIEFFKQDYPKDDIRSHIDAYTLASILRGREDFRKFIADCKEREVEPVVRLMSCSTGDTANTGNCFAQLLANELGIRVFAPTDILYANPDGSVYVGDYQDGRFQDFIGRK